MRLKSPGRGDRVVLMIADLLSPLRGSACSLCPVIPRLGSCEEIGERQKHARAVILSKAKNPALSSFAIRQFHRQSEIPSLRSGQALRCAQDDSDRFFHRFCRRGPHSCAADAAWHRVTGLFERLWGGPPQGVAIIWPVPQHCDRQPEYLVRSGWLLQTRKWSRVA